MTYINRFRPLEDRAGGCGLSPAGAIVLDGAKVGAESIVGAGSVVREGFEVPPRTLAAGTPANDDLTAVLVKRG